MVRLPPTGMKITRFLSTTTGVIFMNDRANCCPDRRAFSESRSDVPLDPSDAIVVPVGMPTPVTSMPISSPATETRLLTSELLAVVSPSSCMESLNCHNVFLPCVPLFT